MDAVSLLPIPDPMAYRSNVTIVKRPWTPEEDERLIAAVAKYGAARWSMIATALETGRMGKQCRERWNNHLCPEVKKTEWSAEEDRVLMQGVAVFGTRWCEIVKAPELSGRTDNSIKNRFYSLQRKMKATYGGGPNPHMRQPESRTEEPAPEPTRTDRIMALARELAFTTYEPDRDVLIEQLSAIANEEGEDADADTSAGLAEETPLNSFSLADFDALLDAPELPPLCTTAEAQKAATLAQQAQDDLAATLESAGKEIAKAVLPLADWAAPSADDEDTLPGLTDDASSAGGGSSRASVASPVAGETAATTEDVTAAFLGGRHARKASLAPLSLPLESCEALTDSPKRMRTPHGARSVPRRPPALLSPKEHSAASSPTNLSPLSTASTELDELAPRRAATGTEEPARDAAAAPLVPQKLAATKLSVAGTDEPGTADACVEALAAEVLSLADFGDLFGDELSLPSPVVSCGKRKAAAAW